MPALTQTDIQLCIDRMDIMQLFAKYCHAIDDCTFEKLREVFAEDAAFDYSSLGETVQGRSTTMHGVQEFIDFLTATMEHMGPGLTHFMTNHLIDVDGDEAEIASHNHVLNIPQGAYYKSHARRTSAGWRIDRFVFQNRLYHDMAKKMGFDV
jgi:hypothetical protein